MADEQDSARSNRLQLTEHQMWERLEARLWRRTRLILGLVATGVIALAAIGAPLLRDYVERQVMERADREIDRRLSQSLGAAALELPDYRQAIREDTTWIKEQLSRSQIDLETRLTAMIESAEELTQNYQRFEREAAQFGSLKERVLRMQQNVKNEEQHLALLRDRYERELKEFREQSNRMAESAPAVIQSELSNLEKIVQQELDELRLILADHTAGKPAMFSTFVEPNERIAQIVGTNFGESSGRVFMRVRVFSDRTGSILWESDSMVLQLTDWNDDRIEARLSSRIVDTIRDARNRVGRAEEGVNLRFGFLIQTASGMMSQWSGKHTDSIIPPERAAVAEQND